MNLRMINIVIILLLVFGSIQAQDEQAIIIGQKHFIHSEILSEEREYWISLPSSYSVKQLDYKKYPLLVLLDGHIHFHAVSGMINFRSSGNSDKREIPEMIVVAIMNVNRERDFTPDKIITKRQNQTGGGDAFLDFLENELIPKIESTYRTLPYRILVGHSLGGLITTYAYLKEKTSFNSFISIDPSFGTWDDQIMDSKLGELHASVFGRPFFLATANWGKRNFRNRDRHIRLFEGLHAKSKNEFNASQKYYMDKNHSSVPLPAIYDGLSHIFEGYNLSYREITEIDKLVHHFQRLSVRNSFDIKPPEELVNRIGYRLLGSSKKDEKQMSLLFFELNATNYPESYNVFDSLGEAHFELGNKKGALESYRKSFALNPENDNAQRMMERLGQK